MTYTTCVTIAGRMPPRIRTIMPPLSSVNYSWWYIGPIFLASKIREIQWARMYATMVRFILVTIHSPRPLGESSFPNKTKEKTYAKNQHDGEKGAGIYKYSGERSRIWV
ncbi:MAG: hypothetical protein OEY31_06095 [Candidatus Bathyarchaeota archaeon]|nr:hypothetical protein [Candidatus Bathyarchaeota archaeon]